MTLDRSMEIMHQFGVDCNLEDPLSVVERMVKNYNILGSEQRLALEIFMDATKVDA